MSFITADFETYYSKSTGYSLAKMTTEEYIRHKQFEIIGVSVQVDDGEPDWTTGHEKVALRLRDLNLSNHYLCCHHAAFDGSIMSWRYGIKPKYYVDTLSMARPLQGLVKKLNLATLAEYFRLGVKGREVDAANGMHLSDFSTEALADYGEYCKNDVRLTYQLYWALKQYSTPQELYIIDMFLRLYTDPVLNLDTSVLQKHLLNVQANKIKLMARIGSIIRPELMSNPQFALVLQQLGVSPPMKTSPKTGKETHAFSKNDPAFKALLEHEDVRVQAVVAARIGVKSTLEETRTQKFIDISKRGPLPIMLNYYGGHTGRASGGDGINPQNLPKGGKLRYAISAPAGHLLAAGDSSQIEARLLAWFAGQFDLVGDFRNGVDIYSKFASEVYKLPVSKENIPERFLGKTCILGLGYGTGATKLKNTLKAGKTPVHVTDERAQDIVDLYRNQFVMITNLWKLADVALVYMCNGHRHEDFGVQLKLICTQEGITLPNGMMLRYPDLHQTKSGPVYTNGRGVQKLYGAKMVENVIQALARIILFTQTAKLDQWLRKQDSSSQRFKLVHSVHDEIVVCFPASAHAEVVAKMQEVMTTPPKWCEGLPVACDIGVGATYGACK